MTNILASEHWFQDWYPKISFDVPIYHVIWCIYQDITWWYLHRYLSVLFEPLRISPDIWSYKKVWLTNSVTKVTNIYTAALQHCRMFYVLKWPPFSWVTTALHSERMSKTPTTSGSWTLLEYSKYISFFSMSFFFQRNN